jgi:hypothetical protein
VPRGDGPRCSTCRLTWRCCTPTDHPGRNDGSDASRPPDPRAGKYAWICCRARRPAVPWTRSCAPVRAAIRDQHNGRWRQLGLSGVRCRRVTRTVAMAHDITHRKQMEQSCATEAAARGPSRPGRYGAVRRCRRICLGQLRLAGGVNEIGRQAGVDLFRPRSAPIGDRPLEALHTGSVQ